MIMFSPLFQLKIAQMLENDMIAGTYQYKLQSLFPGYTT